MLKADCLHDKTNKEWYAVSTRWLHQWKCFVLNQPSIETRLVRASPNEQIGILPPGPISNIDLFDGPKLATDLRINIDYKAVNSHVWYLLLQTYKGGPAIVR